jgi:hypothetical protein
VIVGLFIARITQDDRSCRNRYGLEVRGNVPPPFFQFGKCLPTRRPVAGRSR